MRFRLALPIDADTRHESCRVEYARNMRALAGSLTVPCVGGWVVKAIESSFKLNSQGRTRLCLVAALALTLVVPLPANAEPARSISARLQGTNAQPLGKVLSHKGGRYSPQTYSLLVEGSATTRAYSLDLDRSPNASAAYSAIRNGQSSVSGVHHASWLTRKHKSIGKPLKPPYREHAAVQLAIWAFTNSISLTSESVSDPAILQRAKQLYTRGSSPKSIVPPFIVSFRMRPLVQKADLDNVHIQIQVDDGRGNTTGSEKIRANNAGQELEVLTNDSGIGSFVLPRPTASQRLDLYWEIQPQEGMVFLANGATPLMTADRPNVLIHREVVIDPNQLPGVEDVFLQWSATWLASVQPWSYLVLLVILGLAAKAVDGLLWAIRKIWRGLMSQTDCNPQSELQRP
jgi:hypothetical protein